MFADNGFSWIALCFDDMREDLGKTFALLPLPGSVNHHF
jgi:hypothetical protein